MRVSTSLINQRAVNGMLDQQAKLSQLQTQISSGKKIISPSDDPIGSAKALNIDQSISVTGQYQRNSDMATTRLQLEDNILSNVSLVLNRARELAIQGNNSATTDNDRSLLATELRQRLDELLSLANTRDTNGEYIYSGFQVQNQPFSLQATGGFTYSGDDGHRMIQISPSRTISMGNTGRDVFMEVRNGNGKFSVAANDANLGSGVIDGGTLVNGSSWIKDNYSITFVSDTVYEVRDGAGVVIHSSAYVEGSSIAFNGINTNIKGKPVSGDEFSITPSANQDVFTTVNNLINAFENTSSAAGQTAALNNSINSFLNDMDMALDNVLTYRSSVGVRLNVLESQKDINEGKIINNYSTLSEIRDIDYIQAISDLNLQQVGLESAQKAYMRIQGLSLFNYL